MPRYDYRCENCGHAIEVMHGVNGTGPERCERCDGPMRKLLSSPAILFKGSGWAKKDAQATTRPTGAKSGTDTQADNGPAAPTDGSADKSPSTSAPADQGSAAKP